MELGNWAQAESLLRNSVKTMPDDADARRDLAQVLWTRGAATEAMEQIAAAMELEPADATLVVRAGEMSLAMGLYEEALNRAERAIQLDPKLSAAWALRGRAFGRLSQPDRAMADLQRGLELAPQDAEILMDIALMYRQRGQPTRALTALHSLLDTYSPGDEPQVALHLEGLTLLDLKRPHQAVEVLQLAAERGPPNANVQFHLAQAQFAAGRFADASQAARLALQIDTSHQASRQLLAQLALHAETPEPQRR